MEFSDIGRRCEACGIQDYLPFRCDSCNRYYCLAHKDHNEHECVNNPYTKANKVVSSDKNESRVYKCNYPNCKSRSVVEFKCMRCNRHYCLTHRYSEVHNCNSS